MLTCTWDHTQIMVILCVCLLICGILPYTIFTRQLHSCELKLSTDILPALFFIYLLEVHMRRQNTNLTSSHVFPWPSLLYCTIAVCVLRQTVMSFRLCWTLLALAYFWCNLFLRCRSSIHLALKSLKSTAFFCLHIHFLLNSPAGRKSWAESCTVAAKQRFLHYSCIHSTRIFGTGHHNSRPPCASL